MSLKSAFGYWRRHRWRAIGLIAVLALGVGVATAVVSLTAAVAFAPVPWPEPHRLVLVQAATDAASSRGDDAASANREAVSWPEWIDLRDSRVFEQVGVWRADQWAIGEQRDELVQIAFASSAVISLLAGQPVIGRPFRRDEDETASEVALISYGTWRTRFGGRATVTSEFVYVGHPSSSGRQVARRIVGVLPDGFSMAGVVPEIVLPSGLVPASWRTPGRPLLRLIGQLRGGQIPEDARRAAARVWGLTGANADRLRVARLDAPLGDAAGTAARWLVAGGVLLLLLCCGTLAALASQDIRARQEEIGIRVALGAGRAHILRLVASEYAIVGVFGGLGGLVASNWLLSWISTMAPAATGPTALSVDVPGAAVSGLVAVATLFVFSLAPAVWAASHLGGAMTAKSRAGRADSRWQRRLVAAQLGTVLVFLVAAGLLTETFVRLLSKPVGFNSEGVALVSYRVTRPTALDWATVTAGNPGVGFESLGTRAALDGRAIHTEGLLERLRAVPGVSEAAGATAVPFWAPPREVMLMADVAGREPVAAVSSTVTEDYFDALGMRFVSGRGFTASESGGTTAVISADLERRLFGGGSIGRRLSFTDLPGREFDVIGVVGDVRRSPWGPYPEPSVYRLGGFTEHLVLRGDVAAGGVSAAAIREAIVAYDPQTVVTDIAALENRLASLVAAERFRAMAAGGYGTFALALAVLGVYLLSLRRVSDRAHEFGVRMALGARARDIRLQTFRDGLITAGRGVLLGVPGGILVALLLRRFIVDVSPLSPSAVLLPASVLIFAALLATIGPAVRAGRVDPKQILDR